VHAQRLEERGGEREGLGCMQPDWVLEVALRGALEGVRLEVTGERRLQREREFSRVIREKG
jgi:hypothetical protein